MEYYLQTLEGVGRLGGLGQSEKNYFNNQLNRFYSESHDLSISVYKACKTALENFPEYFDAELIAEYLRESYAGSINEPAVNEGLRQFRLYESRLRQKAAAQSAASEQARAREAAAAAAVEQSEVVQEATEEINGGEEMDENKILELEAAVPTAAVDPASESAAFSELEIGTQWVTSGKEYTVIDEDDKTISYVDETGALHVDAKPQGGGVLAALAAVAAALFFLG